MFCPECGYKNKDENKFCLSCGKSLKNYLEAVNLIDSLGDYGDPDNIKQNIYKTAVEYFDDRKFSEAAEIFLILGKYEDSEEYIEKIYNQAGAYFKDKKYNYVAAVYLYKYY